MPPTLRLGGAGFARKLQEAASPPSFAVTSLRGDADRVSSCPSPPRRAAPAGPLPPKAMPTAHRCRKNPAAPPSPIPRVPRDTESAISPNCQRFLEVSICLTPLTPADIQETRASKRFLAAAGTIKQK